jgi:hypothetical protein
MPRESCRRGGPRRCAPRVACRRAAAGLPLELIADDSVCDYEKAHLPTDAWPPTAWFESWSTGRDVFKDVARESSPIDLRWLVYRAY